MKTLAYKILISVDDDVSSTQVKAYIESAISEHLGSSDLYTFLLDEKMHEIEIYRINKRMKKK